MDPIGRNNFSTKISFIALAIILFGLFSHTYAADPFSDMTLVAENEYLRLYINESNAEIAVYDKNNDQMWYSNPPNWDKEEILAKGNTKNQVGAQFQITYDRGNNEITRDSYNNSVLLNQFEICPLNNGVRVNYIVNELWQTDDCIPQVISQERMENAILSQLDNEKDRNTILSNYTLFELVDNGGNERLDVPGLLARNLSKERIFGDYTMQILDEDYLKRFGDAKQLEDEMLQFADDIKNYSGGVQDDLAQLEKSFNAAEANYTRAINNLNHDKANLVWDLLNKIAEMRIDYSRLGLENIRFGHIEQFINTPTYILKQTPPFIRQNIVKVLQTTDYTPESVVDDHLTNNLNPPMPNIEVFYIPLEYILDGDNLVVRVPISDIKYPFGVPDIDGIMQNYPLGNIKLLPYFGAANTGCDGYIFVPDGSGALIPFNEKLTNSAVYRGAIYGRDGALDPPEKITVMQQQVHLPVFGMQIENNGFLAIIEDGDAFGTIVADVAGNRFSYNFVYPEFTILNRGRVGLERVGYINAYQSRPYQGDIKVRYKFLYGTEADYVGMAKYYQEYLIQRFNLAVNKSQVPTPLFVDLVGAVSVTKPVLGISRSITQPLTTFPQAQAIIEDVVAEGIENIHVQYLGLFSGGIAHQFPRKLTLEKCLGTSQDFTLFVETLEKNNVHLYPHINFMNVCDNRLFNGFSVGRAAARLLDETPVKVYNYNLATGVRIQNEDGYLLSPRQMETVINDFVRDSAKYTITGLSLGDFGVQLYSDFRRQEDLFIDRQQAATILAQQMESLTDNNGFEIMINGGNAIVLPYANSVVNVPLESSGYAIAPESIPFLPMVLRGICEFAGQPINLSYDFRHEFLKALESGAGLHFIWSYGDSSLVKETNYDYLYAISYSDWMEQALQIYEELNNVLEPVSGLPISGHEKLCAGVYKTMFESDYAIVINYNNYDVNVGDLFIGAENYCVMKGGW